MKNLNLKKVLFSLAVICTIGHGCEKSTNKGYDPSKRILDECHKAGLTTLNINDPQDGLLSIDSDQEALSRIAEFNETKKVLEAEKSGKVEFKVPYTRDENGTIKVNLSLDTENPKSKIETLSRSETAEFEFTHSGGWFSTQHLDISAEFDDTEWSVTDCDYYVTGITLGWSVTDTDYSSSSNSEWNKCHFTIDYDILWGLDLGGLPIGYRVHKAYSYTLTMEFEGSNVNGSLSWSEN